MSGTPVSTMVAAVRLPARPADQGSNSEPDPAGSADFPDLLAKLADSGGQAPAQDAQDGDATTQPQNVVARAMLRLAAARSASDEEMAQLGAVQGAAASGAEGEQPLPKSPSANRDDDATGDAATAAAIPVVDGAQGTPVTAGSIAQGSVPPGLCSVLGVQSDPTGTALDQNGPPVPAAAAGDAGAMPGRDRISRSPSREPVTGIPTSAPASSSADSQAHEAPLAGPPKVQPPARTVGGEVRPNVTVAVIGRETHITPALQRLPDRAMPDDRDVDADGDGDATASAPRDAGSSEATIPLRPILPAGQRTSASSSPGSAAGHQPASRESESLGHVVPSANGNVATDQARASQAPAPASPLQQISTRIAAAAHALQSEASQSPAAAGARVASAPVVKVLRLELQPADLGTITIRMSLKQDGLDVRVEAGRIETARMLQTDQEALTKVLSNAGYRIEHMSVAAASLDASAGWDGRGQTSLPASGGQQGWSQQSDARSSSGRQNAEPDRRTFRGRQNDEAEKQSPVPGAGGDLYV